MTSDAEQVRLSEINWEEAERFRQWIAARPDLATFVVSGSRGWTNVRAVEYVLWYMPRDAAMSNGMADGLDTLARACWLAWGGTIDPFPVTRRMWRDIGRRAGIVRNEIMLNRMPGCLLAWCQNGSPGTSHAIGYANELDIPTFVFRS